jgi:hypothetical protein
MCSYFFLDQIFDQLCVLKNKFKNLLREILLSIQYSRTFFEDLGKRIIMKFLFS